MDLDQNINLGNEEPQNQSIHYQDTLDEPKIVSLKRDFNNIIKKLKAVLYPLKIKEPKILNDWDFWGPLSLCLILGLILSWKNSYQNSGIIFITIFGIVWIGGFIISLNSQFLGVNLSIFQCICILGYCMFAIVIASMINLLCGFLPSIFHFIISLLACAYSSLGKL